MLTTDMQVTAITRAGVAIVTDERAALTGRVDAKVLLRARAPIIARPFTGGVQATRCGATSVVGARVVILTCEGCTHAYARCAGVRLSTRIIVVTRRTIREDKGFTGSRLWDTAGLYALRLCLSRTDDDRARINLTGVVSRAVEAAVTEITILKRCTVSICNAFISRCALRSTKQ